MPLSTTKVIPHAWQTHHRPTAESSMTVGVQGSRAGTGPSVYNEGTGKTDPPARVDVAACAARIQASPTSDRVATDGDHVRSLRTYLVTLPIDAGDWAVDDLIEVTSVQADDDPGVFELVLRVRDIRYGSLVWERDLICEDDLG